MPCLSRRAVWPRFLTGTLVVALLLLSGGTLQAAPPAGLSTWTKLDLDGVRINSLAVDPTNPALLFAGSQGAGVFRSTDAGRSWQPVNRGLANLVVNDLSIDPANPLVILAGTGLGPLVGEPTAGVYRSLDRGETWTVALPNQAVLALARTPQNSQVVYAGGGGVFKSTNGGATWTRLTGFNRATVGVDVRGLAVSPLDPNLVVAVGNTEGGTGQVFRTTDGGTTWTMVLGNLPSVFAVAFAPPTVGNVVLVATQTGVFRSPDGGLTFQQTTEELGEITVLSVLFNPFDARQVFIGTRGRGVFQSTDAGNSWSPLGPELGNQTVRSLALDRTSPQTLYAGTDGGPFAFTFAAPPPFQPAVSWFFAEGSTQPPFDTWFLIQNPTDQPAQVRFTFQLQPAGMVVQETTVGPRARFSLFANPILPNVAFSTRIDADRRIFAERAMYVSFDGHNVTGIAGPNRLWLFAEGSTQPPFHTWLLLQNPNSEPTTATITYLREAGPPVVQSLVLSPNARTSVFVNQVLPNAAFSSRVESPLPIVVERAMYRFPGNAATGVSGVNAPSATWYFAEGNTTTGWDTWLLLQNPHSTPVSATITFLLSTGQRVTRPLLLPPQSRQSLFVNQVLLGARFGVIITASAPIIAEKSLFFGGEPRGAAATQGASDLATVWNLAEGATTPPFDEIISILNPHEAAMSVHIDFQLPNGQVIGRDIALGPTRNLVVRVDDIIPNDAVSARVTTSLPSVVERVMFITSSAQSASITRSAFATERRLAGFARPRRVVFRVAVRRPAGCRPSHASCRRRVGRAVDRERSPAYHRRRSGERRPVMWCAPRDVRRVELWPPYAMLPEE